MDGLYFGFYMDWLYDGLLVWIMDIMMDVWHVWMMVWIGL